MADLFNLEAEQAVLGAILVNNDAMERIRGFLNPEHFAEPVHGEIYRDCLDFIDAGKKADPVHLKHRYANHSGLEDVGGASYLVTLAASVASIISAPSYAKTIKELHTRRVLVSLAEDITRSCNTDQPTSELIDTLEQDLHELHDNMVSGRKVIRSMSEVGQATIDGLEDLRKGKGNVGITTGLKDLDEALGRLMPSEVVVIAGRPGMGKTALALFIALRAAIDGSGGMFYSAEMSPEQLYQRLLSYWMKQNDVELQYFVMKKGKFNDEKMEAAIRAKQEMDNLPLKFMDKPASTIPELRAHIQKQMRVMERAGTPLRFVIVDYMQLMKHAKATNETAEVTAVSNGILSLAREFNITMIPLSQLSRHVEQRDNKRPGMSDLRQSGAIEQDASIIIFPYRHEYYLAKEEPQDTEAHTKWRTEMEACRGITEAGIGKNRSGPCTTVYLKSDMAFNWYGDIERELV